MDNKSVCTQFLNLQHKHFHKAHENVTWPGNCRHFASQKCVQGLFFECRKVSFQVIFSAVYGYNIVQNAQAVAYASISMNSTESLFKKKQKFWPTDGCHLWMWKRNNNWKFCSFNFEAGSNLNDLNINDEFLHWQLKSKHKISMFLKTQIANVCSGGFPVPCFYSFSDLEISNLSRWARGWRFGNLSVRIALHSQQTV